MKNLVLGMSMGMFLLAACSVSDRTFSADNELDYCSRQVERTLKDLKDENGVTDYTMMPRNILQGRHDGTAVRQPAKNGAVVSGPVCCGTIMSIRRTKASVRKPRSLRLR